MDWSKPEVLELLYDFFRELRRAGFGYFKLDYIDRAWILGMKHRADQSRGPLAVIREGIRTIRDAVGEGRVHPQLRRAERGLAGICRCLPRGWRHPHLLVARLD